MARYRTSIPANSNPLRRLLADLPKTRCPIRILFVCIGNKNRSPVMELCLRHYLRKAGLGKELVSVESGGLIIGPGETWPPNFELPGKLNQVGVQYEPILPRGVSSSQLRKSSVIFTADEAVHCEILERLGDLYPNNPRVLKKVIPFTGLAPTLFNGSPNVPDPQDGFDTLQMIRLVKQVVAKKLIRQLTRYSKKRV